MKNLSAIIFFLAFLVVGCHRQNNADVMLDVASITIDWNDITEKIDYSSLVEDSVLVVPLETTDDCLIGEISKLLYQNRRIYVADNMSKAVYVFDKEGHLCSKVRAIGNGPEEYLDITAFTVLNSNLFIFDKMKRKIMVYDENGRFLYAKDVSKMWGMDMFAHGKYIYLVNDGSRSDMGNYSLFKIDASVGKDEAEVFLPFEDFGEAGWSISRYSSASKDEALFTLWPFDVLYTVKGDKVQASYKVNFGDKRLPEKYINADGETALRIAIREGYITGMEFIARSDRFVFFSCSDDNGHIIVIYDKESKKVSATRKLYNSYLGGLACSPRQLYVQDGYMIMHRPIETWHLEAKLANINYDNRSFHSDYVREMFKRFQYIDEESNPVIIIQKLKE